VEDYRKHLYQALHAASRDYDQAILTLAAASLALSVTFAHDITPQPAEGTWKLLLGAWAALLVSLVSIVLSFLTSQRVLRQAIEALDRPGDAAPPSPSHAAWLTEILNGLAGGALVGGLAVLGWYALANA
jgi:multisubunit Na+/H+ antiporter MnhB subunit